jgi:hypothetical protein
MAATPLLTQRFTELGAQLGAVEATKRHERSGLIEGDYVDNNQFLNWRVRARDLISKVCGKESEYYRDFERHEKAYAGATNHGILLKLKSIFFAAKDDYAKGYLTSIRNLVQAEVFDNELEQATELLNGSYKLPAAVVAGVVLETTLRQMCIDKGIVQGKLNKMNDDLARVGAYNSLVQKRITALAAIRNSAAHGKPDEFSEKDVADMISQVRNFVEAQL